MKVHSSPDLKGQFTFGQHLVYNLSIIYTILGYPLAALKGKINMQTEII